MADELIEVGVLDELRQTMGEEFVIELLETFYEEAPKMLSDLKTALADGEAETFRRAAHSLKSNSYTFGAKKLAEIVPAFGWLVHIPKVKSHKHRQSQTPGFA